MQETRLHSIIKQIIVSANTCAQIDKNSVKPEEFLQIILDAEMMLKNDPIMIKLNNDVCVVGDIHGSIHSLISIFCQIGYPPEHKYIFLGDYVDRGKNGVDVIMLLYCFKILFPDSVYMLRGNHECEHLTQMYGFKYEAVKKYSSNIYSAIIESFNVLPIIATFEDILLLHGGIPESGVSLDIIKIMQKPNNIMEPSIFADILWSDPNSSIYLFTESGRGVGHIFGGSSLFRYLKSNKMKMLIRSHQVCQNGYEYPFLGNDSYEKTCLTIFSCYDYGNKGNNAAVVILSKQQKPLIHVLKNLNEPFTLPKFVNEELCDHPIIEECPLSFEMLSVVA